jgi:predicted helicase
VRPVLVSSLPNLEASALFPEGVTATTDPKELELIKDDRCVYFCTYMSLPVLQAGIGRRGLGLGIFDEAHRTAGSTDRLYSQGLVDDEFPMKHRLFLTATAKHVDGDGSPVFSMEDESTYGPVASSESSATTRS